MLRGERRWCAISPSQSDTSALDLARQPRVRESGVDRPPCKRGGAKHRSVRETQRTDHTALRTVELAEVDDFATRRRASRSCGGAKPANHGSGTRVGASPVSGHGKMGVISVLLWVSMAGLGRSGTAGALLILPGKMRVFLWKTASGSQARKNSMRIRQ